MQYIHVKKIEDYQPNYKDGRNIIWIRWDIAALTNRKICKIKPDVRWLFLVLVCLETEEGKDIEADLEWLELKSGIEKKHIPKYISKLQEVGLIVTKCNEMSHNVPTDIQTDIHTDSNITLFWDYYLLKVNKKFKLTPDKSTLIRNRLKDYPLDDLKKAVDNFVIDTWADRKNNLDLIYCIGKQQGKRDNLDYWLNIEVKRQPTLRSDKPYIKPEYRK